MLDRDMSSGSPQAMSPDLSVVVLSWNTQDYLRDCLLALDAGGGSLAVEVVVIDNGSEDGSPEMVAAEFPHVRLVRNATNRGYAAGVNQGISLAIGRKICLLGSDTRVTPSALPRLAAFLDAHPQAGGVAPQLVGFDGLRQRACMRFPSLKTALYWDTPLQALWPDAAELRRYQMRDWDHGDTREVDQPPGTCLMLPREVCQLVGPMDERLWLFFNDVDWSLRIRRAGYQLWYLFEASVFHKEGGSTRNFTDFPAEWHRNRISYYRKHFHSVGHAVTKAVLIYLALRQCWRIRRDVPEFRPWLGHCGQVLRSLGGILFSA